MSKKGNYSDEYEENNNPFSNENEENTNPHMEYGYTPDNTIPRYNSINHHQHEYERGYLDSPNFDVYAPPTIYQPPNIHDAPYAPPENISQQAPYEPYQAPQQDIYAPTNNQKQETHNIPTHSNYQHTYYNPPNYNNEVNVNPDTQPDAQPEIQQETQQTSEINTEKLPFPYNLCPKFILPFFATDHQDVVSRYTIPRLKFPRHFTIIHWILWAFSVLVYLVGMGAAIYVWYTYAFRPVVLGINPYTGEWMGALQWFALGPEQRGVIAVGLWSYGIISLGQFAFGIITFGQVSVGIISIGQAGVGLFFMIGQVVLSLGFVPIAQAAVSSWIGMCQLGVSGTRVILAQLGIQLLSPFFSNIKEYVDLDVYKRQKSRQLLVSCHKNKKKK